MGSTVIDIAFVVGYLNREHGGAQRLVYDVCRHLPSDEFDLTVYYLFGEGTFQPHFEEAGIDVVSIDANSKYDVSAFRRFLSQLGERNHDILQTNSTVSGVWGRTGGLLNSIESIVSVEHNVHTAYRRFARVMNGFTLPISTAVVGVSGPVAESLRPWERLILPSTTQVWTIYNGVDTDRIEASFSRTEDVLGRYTNLSVDDTIVGSVGSHVEQKGYKYLIDAFDLLAIDQEDPHLLLIGDGQRHQELQKLARQLGIANRVHFTGRVPDVYPFLPAFDIAVYPSLWEGFGLAMVEAMVAGRPIVASDIRPFDELLDEAGVLVPPGNSDALAEAISSLLSDPDRQSTLGTRARERAISKFSIEETAREYAELYRELDDRNVGST